MAAAAAQFSFEPGARKANKAEVGRFEMIRRTAFPSAQEKSEFSETENLQVGQRATQLPESSSWALKRASTGTWTASGCCNAWNPSGWGRDRDRDRDGAGCGSGNWPKQAPHNGLVAWQTVGGSRDLCVMPIGNGWGWQWPGRPIVALGSWSLPKLPASWRRTMYYGRRDAVFRCCWLGSRDQQ